MCPLCQISSGIKNRAYLKMIQYVRNEDGTAYKVLPKVWERSIPFIQSSIVPLRDPEDGIDKLSSVVCKIVRQGKAGSKDTKYNIQILQNQTPDMQNKCPLNRDLFKGY